MKEEVNKYEEFHAKAVEILKCYGIEYTEELEEWFDWLYHYGGCELNVEIKADKRDLNWYQLEAILRLGDRVIIQASMPNKEKRSYGGEKHLELNITSDFRKELVKRLFGEKETEEIDEVLFEKTMDIMWWEAQKGRGKNIPYAGGIIASMVVNLEKHLEEGKYKKLNKTRFYCFLGDFLLLLGASPVTEKEWTKIMTNKEKSDAVKSWIRSYLNTVKAYYSEYYTEKSQEPHKSSKEIPFDEILPLEYVLEYLDEVKKKCGLK